jgi:hypothetical protein
MGWQRTTEDHSLMLDLGHRYSSYLCLIDQQSAEIIEERRLRGTTPESLKRRFASERPLCA